jgi:hypothetical protein
MKELTGSHFRAWLEACSPHGSVGVAGTLERCPLARYLGRGWRVRAATARYVEPGRIPGAPGPEVRVVGLPQWARRFVRAVDALPEYGGRARRVWPRTALALLDGVEAGLAIERRRERLLGSQDG